jgi:hypothetical protein
MNANADRMNIQTEDHATSTDDECIQSKMLLPDEQLEAVATSETQPLDANHKASPTRSTRIWLTL